MTLRKKENYKSYERKRWLERKKYIANEIYREIWKYLMISRKKDMEEKWRNQQKTDSALKMACMQEKYGDIW